MFTPLIRQKIITITTIKRMISMHMVKTMAWVTMRLTSGRTREEGKPIILSSGSFFFRALI